MKFCGLTRDMLLSNQKIGKLNFDTCYIKKCTEKLKTFRAKFNELNKIIRACLSIRAYVHSRASEKTEPRPRYPVQHSIFTQFHAFFSCFFHILANETDQGFSHHIFANMYGVRVSQNLR